MTNLQAVYDRYKNRDFIEITAATQMKILEWIGGGSITNGQVDVRDMCAKLSHNGFIKFLKSGVLVIKHQTAFRHIGTYPFEFTDNETLIQSVLITNPVTDRLELLCKVEAGTDTKWEVIEDTFRQDLAASHLANEFEARRIGIDTLLPVIQKVNKEHPELKPETEAWKGHVAMEYFATVTKAQVITTIAVNAYLALLQKEILVSKIEQKRTFQAGNYGGNKSKRNPFYRYVVELPPDYKPRTFNVNYVLSDWSRCGHVATRWVRKENAATLAERKHGRVTGRTRGELVAIEVPISPQKVFRRKEKLPELTGTKTFTNQ